METLQSEQILPISFAQVLEGDISQLPPLVASAVLQYRLDRESSRFNGLMAATEALNLEGKVPQSKRISSLRRALFLSGQSRSSTAPDGSPITLEAPLSAGQAGSIIEAANIISDEIKKKGLLYRKQPFNFALCPPYEFPAQLAERMANLSTQALQATEELSRINPQVNYLLNRGATPWEKRLWRNPLNQYKTCAPLNRIDVLDGRIIEFGPTYTDGFATAQILSEAWGMNSSSVKTLAQTFQELYQGSIQNKRSTKSTPSLGLAFIAETFDMREEMMALGNYLAGLNRFEEINTGYPEQLLSATPDILYYYLKPSMLDGYRGNPLPNGEALMEMAKRGTILVPPLKEQLGKKVVLAIIAMYPEFYSEKLGSSNYEELLSFLAPTTLITPNTQLTGGDWVIKPSSEGSCNGVTSSSNLDFDQAFQQAREDFLKPDADLWVAQPKLTEVSPTLLVKPSNKAVTLLESPALKQTLMVAGGKPAGAFATVSSKWIIDDGGYGFPCRFVGGKQ